MKYIEILRGLCHYSLLCQIIKYSFNLQSEKINKKDQKHQSLKPLFPETNRQLQNIVYDTWKMKHFKSNKNLFDLLHFYRS